MSVEFGGVLTLGLLAAIAYGVADYIGGVASRSLPSVVVVWRSQVVGAVLCAPFVLVQLPGDPISAILMGAAVGLLSAVGLSLLFQALSDNPNADVAPGVAVIGAMVALGFRLLQGDNLGGDIKTGAALAFIGVLFTSQRIRVAGPYPGAIWLATALALPGLLTGISLYILSLIDTGYLSWALLSSYLTATAALYSQAKRHDLSPFKSIAKNALAIAPGAGYLVATGLFVFAASSDLPAVAIVVTSQYPIATVLLSHWFGRQPLRGLQHLGLIATGSGLAWLSVI